METQSVQYLWNLKLLAKTLLPYMIVCIAFSFRFKSEWRPKRLPLTIGFDWKKNMLNILFSENILFVKNAYSKKNIFCESYLDKWTFFDYISQHCCVKDAVVTMAVKLIIYHLFNCIIFLSFLIMEFDMYSWTDLVTEIKTTFS